MTSPALADEDEDADTDEGAAEAAPEQPAATQTATASVMIEPLLAIFGFYEGEVDVAVTDSVAAALWAQYFDYELLDTGLSGFGIGLGAPIFFTGEVARGAYVYPLVKFQKVEFGVPSQDEVVSVTYYGPQATIGYQWTWGRPVGFSLRVGGGLEYSFGKLESSVVDQTLSFEGLDYELDTAIGVTF